MALVVALVPMIGGVRVLPSCCPLATLLVTMGGLEGAWQGGLGLAGGDGGLCVCASQPDTKVSNTAEISMLLLPFGSF